MNISLVNNFAIKKNQFANQNSQIQSKFKGLETDTVSFLGREKLTAENIKQRHHLAMIDRGIYDPKAAVKFSHNTNFINFLNDLKVNEKDSEQTKAVKQEYAQKIVQDAISEDVGPRRIMSIAFKWNYDGKAPEKAFVALASLATPEEKRELFLKDDVLKLTHTYDAFKTLVEVFKDDEEAMKTLCSPETNLGNFHLNQINNKQRTELSKISANFS